MSDDMKEPILPKDNYQGLNEENSCIVVETSSHQSDCGEASNSCEENLKEVIVENIPKTSGDNNEQMSDKMEEPILPEGTYEEINKENICVIVETTSNHSDSGEVSNGFKKSLKENILENSPTDKNDKGQNDTGGSETIQDDISTSDIYSDIEFSTESASSIEFSQPVSGATNYRSLPATSEQTPVSRESVVDIRNRTIDGVLSEPNERTSAPTDVALLGLRWRLFLWLNELVPDSLRKILKGIESAKYRCNLGAFVLYVIKTILNAVDRNVRVDAIWGITSIFMMFYGVEELFQCPANKLIPVFLFDGGVLGLMSCLYNAGLRCFQRIYDMQTLYFGPVVLRCTRLTLYTWFIAGACWVYSVYPPNYVDVSSSRFCNPTMYKFSFTLVTTMMILLLHFLLMICASIVYYLMPSSSGVAPPGQS